MAYERSAHTYVCGVFECNKKNYRKKSCHKMGLTNLIFFRSSTLELFNAAHSR